MIVDMHAHIIPENFPPAGSRPSAWTWPSMDHFEPGRFAPELEAQIPRYQYMPFGAGPRICIGMAFALIEGIAILATLARAASFGCELGLDPEPISRVTLRPAGGMPLSVHLH